MTPELDAFVHAELGALGTTLRATVVAESPYPARLFYPVDAAGMANVIRNRTITARDWRLGCPPALVAYGVEVVTACLEREPVADPLRRAFRRAALANLHPRGSHFDGFVARLFASPATAGWHGYALGLAVPAAPLPGMTLMAAIYAVEQQQAIIAALLHACEDYFVSAVQRFGARHHDDLLVPCWDRFRRDIGTFLMRLRHPDQSHEREWIALALAGPRRDPVLFDVIGNRLVPGVHLAIDSMPVDHIIIGAELPFATTREALAAFLGRHGMHGVRVAPAPPDGPAGRV